MRVLYLCHRIPYPPDKGDKIRAFHQVRCIAERHEVDLFALVDDPADLAHRSVLERYCGSVKVARIYPRFARLKTLPYLLTRTPLTLPWFHSAELASEVLMALGKRSYDRIFVYSSAMAQYVDWHDSPQVVTDLVDVDSDKWIQYASFVKFPWTAIYRREGQALRRYEREVCQRSSAVVVTTDREARLMDDICPGANVHVIPNGVDSAYFAPEPGSPNAHTRNTSSPAVAFVGDMSYFPNEEAASFFANSILPLVRKQVRDARFLIVGRNPTRRVRELQKIAGVEVTGRVPDVRPWLAQAQVSVAPFSISAGIPNKVLEAMSCGVPVVATRRGVQGLSADVAGAVETGDTAEELASKVVDFLRNPSLARRKGLEGRERVVLAHNWERSVDLLLDLLENPERLESGHSCAQSVRQRLR
jgi:sugar transferase (PEP-CTERM/EpsH1 system associated)